MQTLRTKKMKNRIHSQFLFIIWTKTTFLDNKILKRNFCFLSSFICYGKRNQSNQEIVWDDSRFQPYDKKMAQHRLTWEINGIQIYFQLLTVQFRFNFVAIKLKQIVNVPKGCFFICYRKKLQINFSGYQKKLYRISS